MPFKVHNVGWLGLEPRAGGCMAYSRSRKLLAVSRDDNSIEIWNFTSHNTVPVLERCIPAQATEGSVEALAFAGPTPKQEVSDVSSDEDSSDSEDKQNKRKKKKNKREKRKHGGECQDNRLFSTGLHGLVIEHDLDHVDSAVDDRRQRVWAVTSGPAWCMKFNRTSGQLAVGTEEGYVCIYKVVQDGLDFAKVLDKQEGRIFCLDWHSSGGRIVTGSADTLRMWDVETGQPVCRMTTGRTEKHRETVVWSVVLLNDMTVVSGDSRGKTSFWNGRTGTLTDGYQTHRGDVLTVAANDSQDEVYSSGVDPVVFHFSPLAPSGTPLTPRNRKSGQHQKVKAAGQVKWVKSIHRFSHTHDVRAILCLEKRTADKRSINKVISIGVDSNLSVYDTWSKTLVKYPPIPHGRYIVLSPAARLMTVRHNDSLDVWSVGDSAVGSNAGVTTANAGQRYLPVVRDPEKLVTLKMTAPVQDFDVSGDGSRLVAVTTTGKIKVFALRWPADGKGEPDQPPTVQKIPFAPTFTYLSRFNHIRLLGNCKQLLASTVGGTLVCFDVESGDTAWSLDSKELKIKSGIRGVEVHNQYCLVTDFSNNLVLVDTSAKDSDFSDKCLQHLPVNNASPVAAAAFDPHEQTVVVVYANHRFMEYSPKDGCVTAFSKMAAGGKRSFPLPATYINRKFAAAGLLFPRKGTVMLYDIEHVCSIDKSRILSQTTESEPTAPKSQRDSQSRPVPTTANATHDQSQPSVAASDSVMKVTKKWQNLLFLGSLDSELVAVENKPQSLEARLPAGIRQKKFGAM